MTHSPSTYNHHAVKLQPLKIGGYVVEAEDAQVIKLFGKTLQIERLAKGWSQEKLAFEANLDRTYVSSVERGRRNISIVNIYKLAKALDISPRSLLTNNGDCDEKN